MTDNQRKHLANSLFSFFLTYIFWIGALTLVIIGAKGDSFFLWIPGILCLFYSVYQLREFKENEGLPCVDD